MLVFLMCFSLICCSVVLIGYANIRRLWQRKRACRRLFFRLRPRLWAAEGERTLKSLWLRSWRGDRKKARQGTPVLPTGRRNAPAGARLCPRVSKGMGGADGRVASFAVQLHIVPREPAAVRGFSGFVEEVAPHSVAFVHSDGVAVIAPRCGDVLIVCWSLVLV